MTDRDNQMDRELDILEEYIKNLDDDEMDELTLTEPSEVRWLDVDEYCKEHNRPRTEKI